nr:DUF364 domain-containing protein [Pantoea sp. 201603H]
MQTELTLLQQLKLIACQQTSEILSSLTIKEAVVGVFFTGVQLSNRCAGLCATPVKEISAAVCCSSSANALPGAGRLRGLPVETCLEDLGSPKPLRRTVAIATLNALIETIWQMRGDELVAATTSGDAILTLSPSPGQHVVMVGAFYPYIHQLRKQGISFKVLEKDPSVFKTSELTYYVPADQAPNVIPTADILIITATTLLNGTLDSLLSLAKTGTSVAIVGPTTPLLPEAFAPYSVSLLGGVRITAPEHVLDLLVQGASGYHLFEKGLERINLTLH